jgi:pantoate--beta-alanine ligase
VEHLVGIDEWRRYARGQRERGRRVGLVPTMGALHDGHVSLFRAARANGDVVLATIFVNPRQFTDAADLAAYPRTPDADLASARIHDVDCLVEPRLDEMWPNYPASTSTTVSVGGISDTLEGAGRPGHFDGVASVVAKLFAITGPCRAYFGEKDFQQVAVVRQMVRDLAFDVEVVGCPIVRDPDGLALSSRNVLLSAGGRDRALALSRAVAVAQSMPGPASAMRAAMLDTMRSAGVDTAYAEVVDPVTLRPATDDEVGPRRVVIAGLVEGVRLIDNGPVTLEARGH